MSNKATTALKRNIQLIKGITRHSAQNHYELGEACYEIRENRLYRALSYNSIPVFVAEQLPMSYSVFVKYAGLHKQIIRLGYSKDEAIDLIGQHSHSIVREVLSKCRTKVGQKTLDKRFREFRNRESQVNVQLNQEDRLLLEDLLEEFGAIKTDTGYMKGRSEAFAKLLHNFGKGKKIA